MADNPCNGDYLVFFKVFCIATYLFNGQHTVHTDIISLIS